LEQPLDPVWEDDLDVWLQKETEECRKFLPEMRFCGENPPSLEQLVAGNLEDEWSERRSRRLLWNYIVRALEIDQSVDVIGGWAGEPVAIRERRVISLEDFGISGVKEDVQLTVVRNSLASKLTE
jgi:hypothetical protein